MSLLETILLAALLVGNLLAVRVWWWLLGRPLRWVWRGLAAVWREEGNGGLVLGPEGQEEEGR